MTRSKGRKPRKESKKLPPFIPLTREMANSNAYKALPYSAKVLILYMIDTVRITPLQNAHYNTEFTFPFSKAKRFGYATSTFYKAICELMEKGFIEPVWKGGLRSQGKSCSRFTLSARWRDYGKPEFKEVCWNEFVQKDPL